VERKCQVWYVILETRGTYKTHDFLFCKRVVFPFMQPFPGPFSVLVINGCSIHIEKAFFAFSYTHQPSCMIDDVLPLRHGGDNVQKRDFKVKRSSQVEERRNEMLRVKRPRYFSLAPRAQNVGCLGCSRTSKREKKKRARVRAFFKVGPPTGAGPPRAFCGWPLAFGLLRCGVL
jgi:hypothetical protein